MIFDTMATDLDMGGHNIINCGNCPGSVISLSGLLAIEFFRDGDADDRWSYLGSSHMAETNVVPWFAPMDGAIALIGANNEVITDWGIDIYINALLVHGFNVTASAGGAEDLSATPIAFSAGDLISVFFRKISDTKARNPIVHLYMG